MEDNQTKKQLVRTNTNLCLDELLQLPRFTTAKIISLIKKAEKMNLDKHRIITFLTNKRIAEDAITEAYSHYYKTAGLYEITFEERPLGFSVTMDKRGNNAIVSRIINKQLGMTVKSKIYAINGKRVYGQKHQNILTLISQTPTPFFVTFKEHQPMMQQIINDTNWNTFDALYKHKYMIPSNTTYTLWRVKNMKTICFKEFYIVSDDDLKTIYNEYTALKLFYDAYYGNNDIIKLYLNGKTARLVMKYYIGEDLNDFLVDDDDGQVGFLFEKDFRMIVKKLFYQLHLLHRNGILHCDLSPWHVRINEQSERFDENDPSYYELRIVNYQNAHIFKEKQSDLYGNKDKAVKLVHIKGTPGFIAPETIRNKQYSVKSDVFAVGCIMFFLLCNEYAVIQSGTMDVEGMEPDAQRLKALLNRENTVNRNGETRIAETTIEFVLLCLQKDPTKRPTAEEAFKSFNDIQIFHQ